MKQPGRIIKTMLITLFAVALHGKADGQLLKYVNGNNSWNADSLGNQRAVVNVAKAAKIAEAIIEWRRRDNPEGKEIIVVDAATQQRIDNVKIKDISREKGTIYFEPLSGAGDYYIYYMPYHVPPGSNYPNAVYLKNRNTASASWLADVPNAQPVKATVGYIESIDALNSIYPMEVIATTKETSVLTAANHNKSYLVFPEDRLHPIKMKTDLPQRWILKGITGTFTDTAAKGENFAFQLGVYASVKSLHNVRLKFSDLQGAGGASISAKLLSCLNTGGINWDNTVLKKTVDVDKGEIQALWCLVSIPKSTASGIFNGTVTVLVDGEASTSVQVKLVVDNKILQDGGISKPWKQTRLTWLNSGLGQKK